MIKVNHWGIEVNSESPITGVINTSDPEWLYEDVERDGIDAEFEKHLETCTNEDHDQCFKNEEATYIIGFRKNKEGEYEPDPEAEYSAIVGGQYTQIVQSRYISRCALCSSCFPGQGDLNEPGEFMTYQLPPDVWGENEHLEIVEIKEVM